MKKNKFFKKYKNKNNGHYIKRKWGFLHMCKGLYPFRSQLEKKIYNKIIKKIPNEKILINQRGLIKSNKKLELDLYFPNYKIGVEIQGPLHTQNETIILRDYKKKMSFLSESNIQIIYIYTNNNKNYIYSVKKCIDILKGKKENVN